ncbi:MAG: hypothetical protein IT162_15955 [Bryobacterales bacterium]|nr:hypothetical protein [Bryobacterales bacterium]
MPTSSTLKFAVAGLDSQVAADLIRMLSSMSFHVAESPSLGEADLVFCNPEAMAPLGQRTSGKLVAVSPEATEESWLSALEKGAADYLPMPCQKQELSWILESHFGARRQPQQQQAVAQAAA